MGRVEGRKWGKVDKIGGVLFILNDPRGRDRCCIHSWLLQILTTMKVVSIVTYLKIIQQNA